MSGSVVDANLGIEGLTLRRLGRYGPIVGLLGMYVVFTLLTDRFLTPRNQLNVLRQVSIIGILAIGVTFPILCAEIDLSFAQVMEFTGMLIAVSVTGTRLFEGSSIPLVAAVALGIGVGALVGFVSGAVTARFGVPSFMSTLAMLFLADGLGLIVSNNRPVVGLPDALTFLGGGTLQIPFVQGFGFPVIGLVFLGLLGVSQLILSYTRFGLYIYAIGGDREAAELMGINVALIRVGVLVISAVFAALAGIVLMGRIGSAIPTMGTNLLLPPIAAVILGGANLFGGSGNMAGTLVGVLILGVLSNGLNLIGIGPEGQLVAQGIVLMLAVLANVAAR